VVVGVVVVGDALHCTLHFFVDVATMFARDGITTNARPWMIALVGHRANATTAIVTIIIIIIIIIERRLSTLRRLLNLLSLAAREALVSLRDVPMSTAMVCCHLPARRLFLDRRVSFQTYHHHYWYNRKLTTLQKQQTAKHQSQQTTFRSGVFGIVAAITNEGVIGINGKLPWYTPLSIDRDHFVNLTRNKILIIGRKTYANEDSTGSHIRHVRVSIVVSKTMKQIDLTDAYNNNKDDGDFPVVRLARSFKDALEMVSEYYVEDDIIRCDRIDDNHNVIMTDRIQCWVAGGENIYREALRHDNAVEVHLTHVNMSIDTTPSCEVVYFPMSSLVEHGFQETSRRDEGICSFRFYTKNLHKGKDVCKQSIM
jgi:dihydrofolate reductase